MGIFPGVDGSMTDAGALLSFLCGEGGQAS